MQFCIFEIYKLDDCAGGERAEGGDLREGGDDAGGAVTGLEVRTTLEEAEGRGGIDGDGGSGREIEVEGGGCDDGKGGEEGVDIELVGRAGGVTPLRASGIDEGGGILGSRHGCDRGKEEQKEEVTRHERCVW